MNSNYKSYLVIILLLVLTVPALLLFIFIRRRKRKTADAKNRNSGVVALKGGSISAFFDRRGNVTFIPYVKDKYGRGKATKKIHILKEPYSTEKLGHMARHSLNSCADSEACTDTELFDRLNVMDWAQFARDKRNISVYFREEYGIVLNSTTKTEDGSYRFNTSGAEMTISADSPDIALGNAILELLARCR